MNMSYCMFQNPALEMRHCLGSMDEADTLSELFLFQSRDEKRSYDLMREYCQNFLDIAHRLDHAEANGVEE